MSAQSQISATISSATREELGRFTESHGLKKNYVVEQALLFFMKARRELPDEALIPARIVLEVFYGLDRRVPPPLFARTTFRGWFNRRSKSATVDQQRPKVVYFVDTWTNHYVPQVGRAEIIPWKNVRRGAPLLRR